MQLQNIFTSLPDNLEQEIFESIIESGKLTIERIISKGHSSPASDWYDQPKHEWVMVLKGEARLEFEQGNEVHLKTGDHLNIPAHTKHRVSWTTAQSETIWLAVHYE